MARARRATASAFLIAALLAQAACSGSGGAEASAPSTNVTASQAVSSSGGSNAAGTTDMTLEPAPGLMIQVPADALTAAATTYDDGMTQTYYDSTATAVTIDVEYYSGGAKPAGAMLAAEKDALTSQGVEATADSATVEGGGNATRLSWTSTAVPPWSQDAQATPVQVASTGIIVDGADGYSYGVYVFADSTRADSTAQMTAILDSIVVSAP